MYQYKKFKLFFWKQAFPSKAPTSWMECMYFKLWMMKMTIETESSEEYVYELVKVSTWNVCMYFVCATYFSNHLRFKHELRFGNFFYL